MRLDGTARRSVRLERGTRFAHDSLVEGAGFEPSVPLAASEGEVERAQAQKTLSLSRGTEGPNPPPSTSESPFPGEDSDAGPIIVP
jgi:hypothetical protein